jgi:cell division septal protein FtsQ
MAERLKLRRRRGTGLLRYVPVTVLLFALAMLTGLCGLFRVTDVVVNGAGVYTETEVAEASGISRGDNLLFLNTAKADRRIMDKLAYVSDVHVDVMYPSTVEIDLTESVAIASIMSGGSYWIIDTDGKILEETNLAGAEHVINVTGVSIFQPEVGKKIQTDNELVLQYLTELLRGFRARGIQDKVTELAVNSIANISFDFDGRFTVNYGEGGGTAKLDRLVEVIGRLEEDARGTLEVAADGSIHYIPV